LFEGEPLPKTKKEGDQIFSGSNNLESSFVIRVTSEVKDSTIMKIKDQLETAITRKGTTETLAEEIASYFTPVAIFIASMALLNVGPNNPQVYFVVEKSFRESRINKKKKKKRDGARHCLFSMQRLLVLY